jgi:hypothetical protein
MDCATLFHSDFCLQALALKLRNGFWITKQTTLLGARKMKNDNDFESNPSEDFVWYLLRWLMGFGDLIDGICIILSLGFWSLNFSYITEKWFMDYSDCLDFNQEGD